MSITHVSFTKTWRFTTHLSDIPRRCQVVSLGRNFGRKTYTTMTTVADCLRSAIKYFIVLAFILGPCSRWNFAQMVSIKENLQLLAVPNMFDQPGLIFSI